MLNNNDIAKILNSFLGNERPFTNKLRTLSGQNKLPQAFFVTPNIPEDLATKAREIYKIDSAEKIIGLINDDALKEFSIFTNQAFYGHFSPFPFVTLKKRVSYIHLKEFIPQKHPLQWDIVFITDKVKIDSPVLPGEKIVNILNAIRGLALAKL